MKKILLGIIVLVISMFGLTGCKAEAKDVTVKETKETTVSEKTETTDSKKTDQSQRASATQVNGGASFESAQKSKTASFEQPVKLGEYYTWTEKNRPICDGDTSTGTYSFMIKNIKPITADEMVALGYSKPEKRATTDYALLTVAYKVENGSIIKKNKGQSFMSMMFAPQFWGVKNVDGDSMIGVTSIGFDDTFKEAFDNKHNAAVSKIKNDKLEDNVVLGSTTGVNYITEGQIVVMRTKGVNNFLGMSNQVEEDYEKSVLFFSMQ